MMTASASRAASRTIRSMSAAVPAATTLTCAGRALSRSEATCACTRVTRAPRSAAADASAQPWRPEERLPRYLTGSMGSRVPPAEMTTCRPCRLLSPSPEASCAPANPAAACVKAARACDTICSGSGIRPTPESLPVRRPLSGSMTVRPRSRSTATFSRVAGLTHIWVCMAGARTTGAWQVSIVAVSMSSARPARTRASRSAEAGATTTSSAHSATATCSTAAGSSKTPVDTGLPLTAARAGAPMNLSADSVATTLTSCPA